MNVIEVSHLHKRYGDTVAVDDVSFTVERGEIFGILGPNGAGKTTTVECVEGLRHPDGGTIRVLGVDPLRDRAQVRQRVGVQLQESRLPEKLKVWEALDLYASYYQRPADWRALLETLGLAGQRNTRYGALSGGQAAAVERARPGGLPGDRDTGRADHRAGPAGPPRHLRAGRAGPRPRGHDPAGHPLHGRGGTALRPAGGDRLGPDRGPGHARAAGLARPPGAAGTVPPVPAAGRRAADRPT